MIIETVLALMLTAHAVEPVDNDLPARYRKWLDEEVVYIISQKEREIFLQLTSNAQRNRFIKEFWEQRDPTPGTEKNEFRDEHYRRIEYANKWLGRETRKPGWKTDRGRIYILLGEPKQKRAIYSDQKLVPQELWFYDADPSMGVPPFFTLIFFKKYGVGDYILYDPTLHGPESLIFLSAGQSFEQAVQLIYDRDPELAWAAINPDPSEMSDVESYKRPTLSAIQLMAQIENIPNYHRSAEYAERILRGEPKIETRFTFDSSGLNTDFDIIKLASGDSLINYSFHYPTSKFELHQYKDTVYGSLDIIFSVMTNDGNAMINETHKVETQLDQQKKSRFEKGGFSYEGHEIILPGTYNATLTVRNRVSKVFYSHSEKINVPPFVAQNLTVLKPILFANSNSGTSIRQDAIPPYAYSNIKFHPALNDSYLRGQEFGVFYQVLLPKKENQSDNQLKITYRLLDSSGGTVQESTEIPRENNVDPTGTLTLFWKFPTAELGLGSYRLEITATRGAEESKAVSDSFTLESQLKEMEPLFEYSPSLDFSAGYPALIRAEQIYTLGRKDVAANILKEAHSRWPADDTLNGFYAQVLTDLGKYDEAADIYTELTLRHPDDTTWKRELATVYLQTGKFSKTIGYLEQVRLQEGDSLEVLNPLGEAYWFSGNKEKAIEMWKRSLDIEPAQPLIKSRLEQVQENTVSSHN